VVSQGVQTVGMARPRRHTLCATLLVALFLTGCTSSTTHVTAPLASVATTPSASPSSLSLEDQARESAKATIERYWDTYTRCFSNPRSSQGTCFDEVAIGSDLAELRTALITAQKIGSTASGPIFLISMDLVAIDLTSRLTEQPPTVPIITYRACLDVSQFLIRDEMGRSIVPANRKARSLTDISVLNYKYPDPSQWRVGFQVDSASLC
jgi:hypothetical protein